MYVKTPFFSKIVIIAGTAPLVSYVASAACAKRFVTFSQAQRLCAAFLFFRHERKTKTYSINDRRKT